MNELNELSIMTFEQQIKVAEKIGKQVWQEFDKHEMTMSDAMIIVSAVTDRTIQMLCEMCNEDYRETLEYFCDTLVQNADFNKLRDELKNELKK